MSESLPSSDSSNVTNNELLKPLLAIDVADNYTNDPRSAAEVLMQYRHYSLPAVSGEQSAGDAYINIHTFDPNAQECVLTDHDDTTALNETMREERNKSFSNYLSKRRIPHTAEGLDHFMDTLHRLSSPGGNHDPAIMTYLLAQSVHWMVAWRTQHVNFLPDTAAFREYAADLVMDTIGCHLKRTSAASPDSNDALTFYYDANGTFTTTPTFDMQGGRLLEEIYRQVMWPLFHQANTQVYSARHRLRSQHGIQVGVLSKGTRDTQLLRIINTTVDSIGSMPPDIILVTPGSKGDTLEAAVKYLFTNPDLRLVHLDDNERHIDDLRAAYDSLRQNGSTIRFRPIRVTNYDVELAGYPNPRLRRLAELALTRRLKSAYGMAGVTPSVDTRDDTTTITQKVLQALREE